MSLRANPPPRRMKRSQPEAGHPLGGNPEINSGIASSLVLLAMAITQMLNWKIAPTIDEDKASKFPDIHRVILQLLFNRGLASQEEIDHFLNPQYEDLHDPFIFRDMEKLVSRIRQAVNSGDSIFIYGDYDADGVCSSALLAETLRTVGVKKVDVYIPHREREGYGLNNPAIDYIASQGAKLIITVDCGSSNVAEVEYAQLKGLDVIICDHHEEPPQIPKGAIAFLNPHLTSEPYPFKQLAAVGVTFKVGQALWKAFDLPAGKEKWLLDLAAIATITDMMPLLGENRVLARFGLVVLNKTKRLGLQELIKAMAGAPGELGVYDVGFKIGPRLNAAGRIDHANTSYELLASTDPVEAAELAKILNATNTERQAETERILEEALEQVGEQAQHCLVLVAVGRDWPVGVVGLVSGKITEKYHRPSLVLTRTEKGLVGSGRSIESFNITSAMVSASEYLSHFGGHAAACGFTLKDEESLEPFRKAMNEEAAKVIADEDLIKALHLDLELSFKDITWDLVEQIEGLAPFGIGNPRPRFASFSVGVREAYTIGNDGKHLRLVLEQQRVMVEAVSFGTGEEWGAKLRPGDLIDIAYEVGVNEWKGNKKIQLKIQDIKKK